MTVTLTKARVQTETTGTPNNVVVPLQRTLHQRISDFVNEMKASNLIPHQGLDWFLKQFQACVQDPKSMAWLLCFLLTDVVKKASAVQEDTIKLEQTQKYANAIDKFLNELMPQGGVQALLDSYEQSKRTLHQRISDFVNKMKASNLIPHQGLDLFLKQFQACVQDPKRMAWLLCFLLTDVVEEASAVQEDTIKLEQTQQFEDEIQKFLIELMPQGGVQALQDSYEQYKLNLARDKKEIEETNNAGNRAVRSLHDAYNNVTRAEIETFETLKLRMKKITERRMMLNEVQRGNFDRMNDDFARLNRDLDELVLKQREITQKLIDFQAGNDSMLQSFERILKGAAK